MNRKMKKIRRVQADGHILHRVTHNPEILEEIYDGRINTFPCTTHLQRVN